MQKVGESSQMVPILMHIYDKQCEIMQKKSIEELKLSHTTRKTRKIKKPFSQFFVLLILTIDMGSAEGGVGIYFLPLMLLGGKVDKQFGKQYWD